MDATPAKMPIKMEMISHFLRYRTWAMLKTLARLLLSLDIMLVTFRLPSSIHRMRRRC